MSKQNVACLTLRIRDRHVLGVVYWEGSTAIDLGLVSESIFWRVLSDGVWEGLCIPSREGRHENITVIYIVQVVSAGYAATIH